jgi:hypothetical protein
MFKKIAAAAALAFAATSAFAAAPTAFYSGVDVGSTTLLCKTECEAVIKFTQINLDRKLSR